MCAAVATDRPPLISDLEKQEADLDRFGYFYIENALPPNQLEAAWRRPGERAAAKLKLGHVYEDAGGAGTLGWSVGQDRRVGIADSPKWTGQGRSF